MILISLTLGIDLFTMTVMNAVSVCPLLIAATALYCAAQPEQPFRKQPSASVESGEQTLTEKEKKDLVIPTFDGQRYSIPSSPPFWDAASRTLISRGSTRNEANHPCYRERRKTLSRDGMTLTTTTMTKIRDSRPYFEKTTERAVAPYLFKEELTAIVDPEEERLSFIFWDVDESTGILERIYARTYLLHSHRLIDESLWYVKQPLEKR